MSPAFEPWRIFGRFLNWLRRIIVQYVVDASFLGDAAVMLIAGGLAMLTVLIFLIMVGNVFAGAPSPGAATKTDDIRLQLRPIAASARRAMATHRPMPAGVRSPRIDRAFANAIRGGLGEPRLVSRRSNRFVVRLYGCRGCRDVQRSADPGRVHGCDTEREDLRTLFGRVLVTDRMNVVETSCRLRGRPHCEFEVRA